MLIEDTWTSGSNAQSAALALRRAGAATVTIVALARWLAPEDSSTGDFVTQRLTGDYDPFVCPLDERGRIVVVHDDRGQLKRRT